VNIEPIEINAMDTPSTRQENFSPRINGERMAVNMMEKQEVEDIKIMFPNHNEIPFMPNPVSNKQTPIIHSIYKKKYLFFYPSILMLPIFMLMRPEALQKDAPAPNISENR
jgi:hypothetical protein